MIRSVTCLLSLLVALAASGCSVGAEDSDDLIGSTDEQSLTHVTDKTDQTAASGSRAQPIRDVSIVGARTIGEGPQPDPWAPVANDSNNAGPQPDPWKPGSKARVVTSTGSMTTDKH